MANQIRVVNYGSNHSLGIVQTLKYEYACCFATERNSDGTIIYPTTQDVKEAWKKNKRDFISYNFFHRGLANEL